MYEIGEGSKKEKTEKAGFTMRVSNDIHGIARLNDVEFTEEWTEYEKIPVKASPITVPPPKKEEAKKTPPKEGEQPAPEGSEEKKPETGPEPPKEEEKPTVIQPEQTFETKEKKKKIFSTLNFTSQSYALAPNQRKIFQDTE